MRETSNIKWQTWIPSKIYEQHFLRITLFLLVAELQLQIISFIKFTSRIWLLCRSINVVAFSCKISNNIDKLIFLLPMAASIIYFSYWGPSIEYNEGNYWYSQLHIHYPVWILDVLDNNWNAHFQFQKLQKRCGNNFWYLKRNCSMLG